MDVTGLIRYTHASRRRYLKTLSELPWHEIVKDQGASFSSIRNIILHSLHFEDRLVNYVIPSKSEQLTQQDYEKYGDLHSIEKRVDEVEKKVNAYLVSLTQSELDRKVTVPQRRGPAIIMRVEDILVNIAIELISHMGELIAILWRIDKRPPFLSWSRFLEEST